MRVFLNSIGCRLNQSEMDSLARQLISQGHQLVHDPVQADLCILNTCSVTRQAERKSRQATRQMHRANPQAHIALTGCYATLAPDENAALPGVMQIVANAQKENLLQIIDPTAESEELSCWRLPGGRTRAFVKVQDGCDNQCAYCITTIARGPSVSRPLPAVIEEIQALEAAGYQEIVLTGVHLGSYQTPQANLRQLVKAILTEASLPRLRLSSLEPWDVTPDFFELWENPRLCRQLHLALQSGSAAVLRRMARKIKPDEYRRLALSALDAIPDLALTTDIIVGFPGESDAEFEESLKFVQQLDFARLHVFGYSSRPGTAAARMPDQIPPALIKERSQRMRELGSQKQEAFLRKFIGRTMAVLWESASGHGQAATQFRGHTSNFILVQATDPYGRQLQNTITPTILTQLQASGLRGIILGDN